MNALIQRVDNASVEVESGIVSSIGKGLLVLLGIARDDKDADMEYIIRKITNLRIFDDSNGNLNLSVRDINGEILVVSQFTLLADCRKGNRPSFDRAERPDRALVLYERFIEKLRQTGTPVSTGIFGASMKVRLTNNGPVTIMLDSRL